MTRYVDPDDTNLFEPLSLGEELLESWNLFELNVDAGGRLQKTVDDLAVGGVVRVDRRLRLHLERRDLRQAVRLGSMSF